jgi:VPDSG-CTERM motif
MNNMNKIKYIAAVLIAIAGLGLQQAKGDTISFDLTVSNFGFTGPYAHVVVNRTTTTTATITFTSLTNSGNIYLMGDGSTVALNVNATTFTAGTVTGSNAGTGFTPGPYTTNIAAGQQVDGFGKFNFTIDSFDGFTHTSDTVSFTLTNVSGTWATASDVLKANTQGSFAASHIFVTSSPANASNSALITGFASNGGSTAPDGGTTVMLLGAALGALGMARRFIMS